MMMGEDVRFCLPIKIHFLMPQATAQEATKATLQPKPSHSTIRSARKNMQAKLICVYYIEKGCVKNIQRRRE
jgi:hypothetical protein